MKWMYIWYSAWSYICLSVTDMEDGKRNMYSETKFKMEYSRNGENWTYVVELPNGTRKPCNFKVGEKFDWETLDGRPIVVKIWFLQSNHINSLATWTISKVVCRIYLNHFFQKRFCSIFTSSLISQKEIYYNVQIPICCFIFTLNSQKK